MDRRRVPPCNNRAVSLLIFFDKPGDFKTSFSPDPMAKIIFGFFLFDIVFRFSVNKAKKQKRMTIPAKL